MSKKLPDGVLLSQILIICNENLKDVQQKALRQKKLELIQDLNLRGIEREEINLAKIQEYIMKQETVIDKENVKNLKKIAKTIEKEIKEVTNM